MIILHSNFRHSNQGFHLKIQAVARKKDLRKFIDLPYLLHKNLAHWIPPLKLDQRNIFNPKKNSLLAHCDYQLFLLYNGQEIAGRIAVYINKTYNDHWRETTGFFGHYECIDNKEASRLLLQTAADWLGQKGMGLMRGPWNFVSQDFGFVYEGFHLEPTVLSSYNPAYYNRQMTAFGMQKAKDLLVYNCDITKGYAIPGRFLKFTDRIAERYKVTVRSIDMKHLVRDTKIIVRLSNESLSGNWGYYPIRDEEAEQIAADLKMIVHPQAVLIAEAEGEPIGYIIALPDINHLLKDLDGKLFPFGIVKLLNGIKKLRHYRIWAMGLAKAYQKKGISILLFRRLNEILAPRKAYVEANYVLEDNILMNNALKQLEFDMVKKYRVYEKELS